MKLSYILIPAMAAILLSCEDHDFKPLPVTDKGSGPTTTPDDEYVEKNPAALYNGIVLPAQWPTKRSYSNDIRKGMTPADYWDKPAVAYATVGRQMFVDDFLIKSTTMRRVYHYPEVYTQPVLTPDKSWETSANGKSQFAAPFSDGVWYDELDGKFKMWYMAADDATCYAESTDGITWSKPELDVYEGTNIVRKGSVRDASSIWVDKSGNGARYKMFEVCGGAGNWAYQYLTSTDGIHWRDQQAASGSVADRSTVFYSPFRNVWAWSMRHNVRVTKTDPYTIRARDYMENADPVAGNKAANANLDCFWFGTWPTEQTWSQNVSNDGAPGIYNHDAMPYESVMLGFFSVWQGPENDVCNQLGMIKRNQIMVGYSRDGGYSWQRDDMNPFIAIDESAGSYRGGNLQSAIGSPIIVGDKLYFYFSARRMENKTEITTTGLATMRRDGFASMSGSGLIVTDRLLCEGSTLWLNARIGKSLKIEILDSEGNEMSQFTTELQPSDNCAIKVCDGLAETIKNKAISLRFTASDCDIYSFWIGDTNGKSRGYTAGGGPGLSPTGIDQ